MAAKKQSINKTVAEMPAMQYLQLAKQNNDADGALIDERNVPKLHIAVLPRVHRRYHAGQ